MLTKAYIPYGGYYSSPFCKWQGSLANENAIELGARTARQWLERKGWEGAPFDYLYLGITVGQQRVFYGSTWAAAMMGVRVPGMTVMQACSTATTCVFNAAMSIEQGLLLSPLCLLVDRCSNGPHTIWPNPLGPGGEVISENWNMDNMNGDPATGHPMVVTAENVAREAGFTREEADELAILRYEQYVAALKDDRAFQKRYMVPVEARVGRKQMVRVEADEGVTPCTAEGLQRLKPVVAEGIHTFGSQTHPADGNAALLVTTKERAAELSADPSVSIRVVSYGFARTRPAFMPAAPVPAARMALERAGIGIKDVTVIKTHNPFAANDLYFAKELGVGWAEFNNFGSSMIFGHPQAPTVARLLIEGIEEAVLRGGGHVLVAGCAAGDTGAALVLKVDTAA
ncbi:acetyl-CoA acetyltransferases [Desulfacinum infernum DSM 9756]|uniref:Acetyl-CoA acetyltransferases n=1 Tax=Desulfacinum infernum DSM 9756 TaxID=1121391 RepID=A0A1M5G6H9_9BACT|nr:thiolase family protein [Desulfacinum infernum]SHF99319.1 acetyl-CoA acetyltransferases [Desulfacinum infernum DSM 9756]